MSPCVRPCRRSSGPPGRYGAKQHYGFGPPRLLSMATAAESPQRVPQRPRNSLRSDRPVRQIGKLDPRRVTEFGRSRRGNRAPRALGFSRRPHRLSSGMTRSSGRIGWAKSHRMGLWSPDAGGESNPKPAGSGVCRSEAGRDRCPRRTPQQIAVAVLPQLAVGLSPPGRSFRGSRDPIVARTVSSCVFLSVFESHVCDNSLSQEVGCGERDKFQERIRRRQPSSSFLAAFERAHYPSLTLPARPSLPGG